jgi:signal transduction histidine kinase/CheY-like chemotaxis protein
VSEATLPLQLETVFEALLSYWEQGDETEARVWARRQTRITTHTRLMPAAVIGQLDLLSQVIRSFLESSLAAHSALFTALSQLDAGMRVLRRCYLEAYEGLTQQQLLQLHNYEAVRRRGYECQVLYDFVQQVSYTLRYDELIRQMLEHLSYVVPYDVAASMLRTEQLYELFIRPARPLDCTVQDEVQRRQLQSFSLMNGSVTVLKPEHLHIRILESELFDATLAPLMHLGSTLQVPLIVGPNHDVVGLLFVGAEQREVFTEDQVRLLYTMANQASLSIQRLRALLADSQQRLESLIEHLPEGVLMLDANLHLVLANPMAKAYLSVLTNVRISEALTYLGDCPIADLLRLPPEELGDDITIEGPSSRSFEVQARPLQGGPEAGGWILLLRDVTASRQAQDRAQQQERLAAVGQLAAGIAHDFNNLLTGIIGFADILQQSPDLPASAQEKLARIVAQGERGAHLVRQILDFSRLSISQLQPFDLVPFVTEAVRFLQHTIPENIRIRLTIDADAHIVRADPTRLEQVLMNLAINAWDAMPSGGELTLRLSHFTLEPGVKPPCPEMPPGAWEMLTVSDTGMGIAAEDVSRIFEPFFTTKAPGKGSGLGLAQVYGLVRQHQGYIRVDSREGEGTAMVIYLPALAHDEWQPVDGDGQESPTDIPHGHGETVLVVEDEPVVSEVCTVTLEDLGYHVLWATNGQQALDVYATHADDIDLVLTDMVMPGMNGVELFHALRSVNPAIKTIMMTGYPLGEEGKQLLAQGMQAWIQKPLNLGEVARVLRRVLHTS